MFTQQGNTNKGNQRHPDTYIGIFSVTYHSGYIVMGVVTLWKHHLWCDYLHLSGNYVCFPT